MNSIGKIISELERQGGDFTAEALAKELPVEWMREALHDTGKESVREPSCASSFSLWQNQGNP